MRVEQHGLGVDLAKLEAEKRELEAEVELLKTAAAESYMHGRNSANPNIARLRGEINRLREALRQIVDFDPKSRRLAAHIARDALAGSSEANDAGVIAPQSASESNEPYWARPLKADDEGPSRP